MASVITITDAAAQRVAAMIAGREKPTEGVRIGVRTAGCSGLSYTLEFADEVQPADEVVRDKGVTVFVDPKATVYLVGTEMDFETTFDVVSSAAWIIFAPVSWC